MAKRKRQRERDLTVEIREVEGLSVECECGARIEVGFDGSFVKGAKCPQCGRPLDGWRKTLALFHDFMRETMRERVRLRVRLLRDLPL